ncbi:hypothetical protein Slin15195_G119620 [Septoria linicola]|uniref:CHRD domain-containing protein n=1 Tax=Septoria linicola TaxID=215465 RepID=A0A9Q9B476_9PEZI|nr:hypothetical protein Slin14017_G096610 [Septoria linicola]USW58643.1 hypothetical protein Slin15195_G119620 [Septoria linicola]
MKASVICASLLAGVAMAAPEASNKKQYKNTPAKPKYDKDCDSNGYYKGAKGFPIPFTSTYRVKAVPGEVVSMTNQPTGGLPGAVGFYDLGVNSELDTICYYIRLYNIRGEYQSPADTATHIHESARGRSGPPRIAFPNPQPVAGKNYRVSVGCLTGPFETGIINNSTGVDVDTGAGFKVAQIEVNPKGFNADVHTNFMDAAQGINAVPGAVRGQLAY